MLTQRNPIPKYYKSLQRLILKQDLSSRDAMAVYNAFAHEADGAKFKTIMILLREKTESVSEMTSLASFLQNQATCVPVNPDGLTDNCGTGGDGKGTFNISTVSALVAAAAGARIAKHGNRSISSKVRSSDLLEALGVKIDAPVERMARSLAEIGFAYFHAPLYHPVMSRFQLMRRKIRGRTIFNLMGPLVNPARVKRQIVGVNQPALLATFAQTMKSLGRERAFVFSGQGAVDEITPYGVTRGYEIINDRIQPLEIRPEKYGCRAGSEKELRGGNLAVNKKIATDILTGTSRDQAKVCAVLLNAGLTLVCSGVVTELGDGVGIAKGVLHSGRAIRVLERFSEITRS